MTMTKQTKVGPTLLSMRNWYAKRPQRERPPGALLITVAATGQEEVAMTGHRFVLRPLHLRRLFVGQPHSFLRNQTVTIGVAVNIERRTETTFRLSNLHSEREVHLFSVNR